MGGRPTRLRCEEADCDEGEPTASVGSTSDLGARQARLAVVEDKHRVRALVDRKVRGDVRARGVRHPGEPAPVCQGARVHKHARAVVAGERCLLLKVWAAGIGQRRPRHDERAGRNQQKHRKKGFLHRSPLSPPSPRRCRMVAESVQGSNTRN